MSLHFGHMPLRIYSIVCIRCWYCCSHLFCMIHDLSVFLNYFVTVSIVGRCVVLLLCLSLQLRNKCRLSAFTLLASSLAKNGGWWRWTLVSLCGVAPNRIVCVSAFVNLPLHHKVQNFVLYCSPGWSRKRVVKQLWWWWSVCRRILALENRQNGRCRGVNVSLHRLRFASFCNDPILDRSPLGAMGVSVFWPKNYQPLNLSGPNLDHTY